MKIAINGAGIAGPALAWWLQYYGHAPVLFERASSRRQGGYVIDFWGKGYDIAEKMGILPELEQAGYKVNTLKIVNNVGKELAHMEVSSLRDVLEDRYLSIAAMIFQKF